MKPLKKAALYSRLMPPGIIFLGLCASGIFIPCSAFAESKQSSLTKAIQTITSSDLKKHVDVLADDTFEGREAGSRGGQAAAKYLIQHLKNNKLKGAAKNGSFYQTFGNGYRNILAVLPGSDKKLKQQYIIVGAHYDHVGYGQSNNSFGPTGYIHNGADDNASGVASLLEMIDAIKTLPKAPRRSILFAFWDGEEKGLLGSKHWIASPTIPLSSIAMMVNIDMVGRLRNNRIDVFGTRTSYGYRKLVSLQNESTRLKLNFNWELKDNSDHSPFFRANIPFLMFHTGLHSDYHRPSDDADKVNHKGMQRIVRLLFAVAVDAANRNQLAGFRKQGLAESPSHKLRLEQGVAPGPPRLGISWKTKKEKPSGVVITSIRFGSAAEAAGILVNDRLLKIDGQEIKNDRQLISAVVAAPQKVEVEIKRPGEKKNRTLQVKLHGKPVRLGITWRRDQAAKESVVVVSVVPGSPVANAGLNLKDRIYRINGKTYGDDKTLAEALAKMSAPIKLVIERDGMILTKTIDQLPVMKVNKDKSKPKTKKNK